MHYKNIAETICFVRIDPGENINEILEIVAKEKGFRSGTLQGIGALESAILGFYDAHKKEYIRKEINGEMELVSCMGNISWENDQPFIHLHATVSDQHFNTFGGHLFSAVVSVTGEFFISVYEEKLIRKRAGEFALIQN